VVRLVSRLHLLTALGSHLRAQRRPHHRAAAAGYLISMGAIDRIVQAVTGPQENTDSGPSDASGPAAASGSGEANIPSSARPTDEESGAQASDGPSGVSEAETALGGADAVPDTPDGVVEDYT